MIEYTLLYAVCNQVRIFHKFQFIAELLNWGTEMGNLRVQGTGTDRYNSKK